MIVITPGDTELRTRILTYLEVKGEITTVKIVQHMETWVGASKTRCILAALLEEGLVSQRRISVNRGGFTWKLPVKGLDDAVMARFFLNPPEIIVESPVKEFDKILAKPPVKDTSELIALEKSAWHAILRKEEKRRKWAEARTVTSEKLIKQIHVKLGSLYC